MGHQVADIAVDRARRDLERRGDVGRLGQLAAAQDLKDGEQAIGATA